MKQSLVISNDSTNFDIILDIDEGNPVIVNEIFIDGIDTTADESIIKQFEYLKGQNFQ